MKDSREILRLVRNDKKKHFKLVYHTIYKKVIKQVKAMYGRGQRSSHQDLEDLAQDVMISIYKNIDKLQNDLALNKWISTICKHTIYDAFRKKSRSCQFVSNDLLKDKDYDDEYSEISVVESQPGKDFAEKDALNTEFQVIMVRSFAALKSIYRKAANLVIFQDYQYDQAANALGLPHGTVKSRVWRAKRDLCKMPEMESLKEEYLNSKYY